MMSDLFHLPRQCGGIPCMGATTGPLPENVAVILHMDMLDHILGLDVGRYGARLNVRYEVRHVGK